MQSAEKSLLQRIAQGDRQAVQECLDRYGGLVASLARRLLARGPEVDDVIQEIFIELWRSAPRYDPSLCPEPTFVAMIARRRAIDARRRRSRQADIVELPEVIVAEHATPLESAELNDEALAARGAFAQLRPEQQQVLRMSIYGGLSHQEIAANTGLPLGTVKTHARRGLDRVRELLARRTGSSSGSQAKELPT